MIRGCTTRVSPMSPSRILSFSLLALVLGGCASRPVNPPITQADPRSGYRLETRQAEVKNKNNLVVLAFSGGGTRAAAFSYGVLEFLRRTEIEGPLGNRIRLLDEVDVITGVSGGSFTALAYGLYGEQALRRIRAALPETRRAGRDHRPRVQSRLLGESVVDGLGPFRACGAVVRRDPVRRCDLRRSQPRQGTDDTGVGHGHFDRRALRLQPAYLRCHLLGLELGRAVARGGGLFGGAGCAVVHHADQLRRDVQHEAAGVGAACSSTRKIRRGPPHGRYARSGRSWHTATACSGPTSISSTAECRTTWACAACSMRWTSSKRCTRPACHRRSTARAGSSSSSSIRVSSPPTNWDESEIAAGHDRYPAEVGGRPDRRVLVRDDRSCCETRQRDGRRCACFAIRLRSKPTRIQRWRRAARADR